MNRREFVAGAGLLAGATALGGSLPALSFADTATHSPAVPIAAGTTKRGRIDIHHGIVVPGWPAAVELQQWAQAAGASLPGWSVQQSLELLDKYGIQTAITSVSAPGGGAGGSSLARRCNEFAAQMAVAHPGRFGSFATLPLPDTEQACFEAIYALDTLHADGITLFGSNDGIFLGDPRFDALMAELDRRHTTVFVQPNLHASSLKLGLGTPPLILEVACDITRAALNLVFTGTLERYPRISWILANGGGFLPYAAWRVSLANALPEFNELVPQGVMTYLRRFYFDTAMSSSTASMAVLKELVEPTQILFGSGFPQAPAPMVGEQLDRMKESPLWSPATSAGIERGHALALLPRYRAAGEQVELAPVNESESTGQWLGRMAKKPMEALVQQLKQ